MIYSYSQEVRIEETRVFYLTIETELIKKNLNVKF